MMQGAAEFHHQVTDALLPQANPVFHDATALDTTVDMLDPEPTLVECLVGLLLLQGQLLSPSLRDEAVRAQASGVDRVMGGEPRAWGLGFAVEDGGYGMGGVGGSVGWACTSGHYAYGFTTGSMGGHDRSDTVENALRDVVGLPPL